MSLSHLKLPMSLWLFGKCVQPDRNTKTFDHATKAVMLTRHRVSQKNLARFSERRTDCGRHFAGFPSWRTPARASKRSSRASGTPTAEISSRGWCSCPAHCVSPTERLVIVLFVLPSGVYNVSCFCVQKCSFDHTQLPQIEDPKATGCKFHLCWDQTALVSWIFTQGARCTTDRFDA